MPGDAGADSAGTEDGAAGKGATPYSAELNRRYTAAQGVDGLRRIRGEREGREDDEVLPRVDVHRVEPHVELQLFETIFVVHGRAEVRFADGHIQIWPLNQQPLQATATPPLNEQAAETTEEE